MAKIVGGKCFLMGDLIFPASYFSLKILACQRTKNAVKEIERNICPRCNKNLQKIQFKGVPLGHQNKIKRQKLQ